MKRKFSSKGYKGCFRAFTLMELLVVIAIIALLMSILVPSLQKAKESAKAIACLANLHGIGIAWMTYASDNRDKLVGADMGPGQWVDQIGSSASPYYGKANWTSWQLQWSGTIEELQREREDVLKRGVLWPYVDNVGTYKCPSHQKQSTREQIMLHPTVPRDPRKLSYAIVGLLNGGSVWGAGASYGKLQVYTKMSQIKQPSLKLALTEQHDPRGDVGDNWAWTYTVQDVMTRSVLCEYLAVWHDGSQSWARCDGSAEKHRWKESETIEFAKTGDISRLLSPGNEDMVWIAKGMPGGK